MIWYTTQTQRTHQKLFGLAPKHQPHEPSSSKLYYLLYSHDHALVQLTAVCASNKFVIIELFLILPQTPAAQRIAVNPLDKRSRPQRAPLANATLKFSCGRRFISIPQSKRPGSLDIRDHAGLRVQDACRNLWQYVITCARRQRRKTNSALQASARASRPWPSI